MFVKYQQCCSGLFTLSLIFPVARLSSIRVRLKQRVEPEMPRKSTYDFNKHFSVTIVIKLVQHKSFIAFFLNKIK